MIHSTILIPPKIYLSIQQYLFPKKTRTEQVAFIFAEAHRIDQSIKFEFKDWYRVQPNEYEYQSLEYVELKDEMRPKIIKMAFDLDTSIVEIHSHPYSRPAMFSFSDIEGFNEFVPHIWWRLNKKPYAAIVFSKFDFDALVWTDDPIKPQQLTEILVKKQHFYPNCLTLRNGARKYEYRSF